MTAQAREETVITDIVGRVTKGNLSSKTSHEHWRIVEYELEDDIGEGRGVVIGPWSPGPLTIRLGVEGHYRINLLSRYGDLRLKLTGDRCFGRCEPVIEGSRRLGADDLYREGYYDAEEVFWREADLTGQDLILDGQARSNLLAIRLIPIDPPKADTRKVRRPMFITLDGDDMGFHVHQRPDDLFERPENVPQDSCVRILVYGGVEGDVCNHHTKTGTEHGALRTTLGDAWDEHNRITCENLERWREWDKNPAVAMVEYAHQRGWKMYFYLRLGGWDSPAPFYGCKMSRFFLEHPEYHIVGPGGKKVLGLSVAYPEVLDHLAAFSSEFAGFGADGVSPCFIRGCPMALYEPIMVEGFKKEYGGDPRELPPSHADWQDYRAKIITHFMRRMKEALGDCRLSPIIHGTRALNRRFALDVAAWVREGIVNDLFIMGHQYDRHDGHYAGGPEHLEFEYFQNLPGRENVRLWPMFYPYGATENYRKLGYNFTWEVYCEALQRYMDQGADGYGLWDATSLDGRTNIFDLGKLPRPRYQEHNRLVRKYELVQWSGYLWNRCTPLDSA